MGAWQRVSGVVVRGARKASGIDGDSRYGCRTIELQMPLFQERGLDLSSCFAGTINVSIAPKAHTILIPEPTFRGVRWHKDHEAENFFFSRCRICFEEETYPAWVYGPELKPGHPVHSPSLIEILAEKIPGIMYGSAVVLELNPEEVRIGDPR